MHVVCSFAVVIAPMAPDGANKVRNEGSRKILARMFPVPHYKKCPSGAGPQEGRVPFRRFVVFMVLPLGGFHGSAVLAFCRFATHPPILY